MREILFRGKDEKSGIWRRGYFVKEEDPYNGDRYIIMWEADICREFPIMRKAKVIPETVSQFTGFYDMDGNMIFEGDILKSTYPDEPHEPSVAFEEVFWDNGWYQSHFDDRENASDLLQSCLDEYSEVFGNRWDDAELLRRRADDGKGN